MFPQRGAAPKFGEYGGEAKPHIMRGKAGRRRQGDGTDIRKPFLQHNLRLLANRPAALAEKREAGRLVPLEHVQPRITLALPASLLEESERQVPQPICATFRRIARHPRERFDHSARFDIEEA